MLLKIIKKNSNNEDNDEEIVISNESEKKENQYLSKSNSKNEIIDDSFEYIINKDDGVNAFIEKIELKNDIKFSFNEEKENSIIIIDNGHESNNLPLKESRKYRKNDQGMERSLSKTKNKKPKKRKYIYPKDEPDIRGSSFKGKRNKGWIK